MCLPLSALLALTCSSAPGPAQETVTAPPAVEPVRALAAELGTHVGLFTGGYAFAGGRWEDAYLANTSSARYLLGGFTLDGGLMSLLPLERGGPGASTTVTARLGFTGERWSVVGGAVVGLGFTSRPLLQLLPSVKGLYRVGRVDLEAGLFDAHGQGVEGFLFQYGDVRTSLVTVGVVGRPTATPEGGAS